MFFAIYREGSPRRGITQGAPSTGIGPWVSTLLICVADFAGVTAFVSVIRRNLSLVTIRDRADIQWCAAIFVNGRRPDRFGGSSAKARVIADDSSVHIRSDTYIESLSGVGGTIPY